MRLQPKTGTVTTPKQRHKYNLEIFQLFVQLGVQLGVDVPRSIQASGFVDWRQGLHSAAETSALYIALSSPAVVDGISKFQGGTISTKVQKGFAMAWLGCGMVLGQLVAQLNRLGDRRKALRVFGGFMQRETDQALMRRVALFFIVCLGLLYCVPAIGGAVVDILEIVDYGTCVRV